MSEQKNPNVGLSCPFCWDDDFDAIGLKNHLLSGHCDQFERTESILQEATRKQAERDAALEGK